MAAAQDLGTDVDFWITGPAVGRTLAKLKKATGSNEPLFAVDPTQPSRRVIEGRPLLVTPGVAAGVIWGVSKARTFVVLRQDVTVESDRSVFFTSDRVAVKATLRAGFGFPHAAAGSRSPLPDPRLRGPGSSGVRSSPPPRRWEGKS